MPPARPWTVRLRRSWRSLLRELGAFGVVGAACFALDVGLFQLCASGLGWSPVLAKATSASVSAAVAFVGHRWWSFSRRARTGLPREGLLFAAVNVVTLLIGVAIVGVARYGLGLTGPLQLQAANVTAIAVGTLVRFTAYRSWVFPAVDRRAGVSPPAGSPTDR
ncbi:MULTISPECIES: GtrA family protein [unclassified Blastococcus]